MSIPDDLKYTQEHEWVREENDGLVVVGITDHAQQALGDVVYVELPEVGGQITCGETFGSVESVKAASDLYAPVAGEVVAINEALEDAPDSVNASPYENGWLIRVRLSDEGLPETLLDCEAYGQLVADEEGQ